MSKNPRSVPVKKEFIMGKLMDHFLAAPAGASVMGNIHQVKYPFPYVKPHICTPGK